VITVDNGIASVEGVAELKRLGIATLITDHHLPAAARNCPLPPPSSIPTSPAATFRARRWPASA
jgi:single-stranded-DNA-specific exonuclease